MFTTILTLYLGAYIEIIKNDDIFDWRRSFQIKK